MLLCNCFSSNCFATVELVYLGYMKQGTGLDAGKRAVRPHGNAHMRNSNGVPTAVTACGGNMHKDGISSLGVYLK